METSMIRVMHVLFPVIVCIGLGCLMARIRFPWDAKVIGPLVLRVALPSLIVARFSRSHVKPDEILDMMLGALLAVALYTLVSWGAVRLLKISVREYLGAFICTSMATGLPVSLYAFGDKGLSLALGFAAIMLTAQFTIGTWLPEARVSLGPILKSPLIYSIVVALVLLLADISTPAYVDKTLELIGGMAIPLLLLTLGVALAHVRLSSLSTALFLAIVHLTLVGTVGITLSYLLGFQGEVRGVFILLNLMPSSTINLLVATKVGGDTEGLASFIFASTILLLVSMPLALTFLV